MQVHLGKTFQINRVLDTAATLLYKANDIPPYWERIIFFSFYMLQLSYNLAVILS